MLLNHGRLAKWMKAPGFEPGIWWFESISGYQILWGGLVKRGVHMVHHNDDKRKLDG